MDARACLTGSMTPWLARGLAAPGLLVVVMDARRAADALKVRPVKTDRADAQALAEMLQTGWSAFGQVAWARNPLREQSRGKEDQR